MQIVALARTWAGTPYLHQASAKGQGADCLGLVRGVWRELCGEEPEAPPPYTPDWNERHFAAGREPLLEAAARHLIRTENARPGDVLLFRIVAAGPAKHCGILTEEDRFIHAYAGRCVLESWYSRWWRERVAAAFAFPAGGRRATDDRQPATGTRQPATGNRQPVDRDAQSLIPNPQSPLPGCRLPSPGCRLPVAP